MKTAIALLEDDWATDPKTQATLLETIQRHISSVGTVDDLAERLEEPNNPILLPIIGWRTDLARTYAAWIRVLPNSEIEKSDYQAKIYETSYRYFSAWRRNTPATVLQQGATTLRSPFARGFGMIPALDNGGLCPLGMGFGKCASEAARWDLLAHYEPEIEAVRPHDFGMQTGQREVDILTWFVKAFRPKPVAVPLKPYDIALTITVFIDEKWHSALQALIEEEKNKDVVMIAGSNSRAQKIKVNLEKVTKVELTKEKLTQDEDDLRLFVLDQETAAEARGNAPAISSSVPLLRKVFGGSRAHREPCLRVIVESTPKAAAEPRKVHATRYEFVSPAHPLVIWDCIWEAIFRLAKATRAM